MTIEEIRKGVHAEHPFEGYLLYKVFHKGEGRYYACLVPEDRKGDLKRMTISYARYLMSVHLGRRLRADEHVDHKDNNKTNDTIDNLQIMTISENTLKGAMLRPAVYWKMKCPSCGKEFVVRKCHNYIAKGCKYTACSRSCSARFAAFLRNPDTHDEAVRRIEDSFIEEFKMNWAGEIME